MSVFVALGMVVFLGSAAIAIDLGHLMNVRTESQRVADAAALAAASIYQDGAGLSQAQAEAQGTVRAQMAAGWNTVNQTSVTLPAGDVQWDWPNERVRVTVRHTAANGNPIATIFARVLGINQVDVVTTAVAQAYPAAGSKCILPFMLPDRYREDAGSPDPNRYDGDPDYYEPYDPKNPSPTATGYTEDNIGDVLVIKPSQGNNPGKPNPGWYYPIAVDAFGGSAYRDWIAGCANPDVTYAIDDMIPVEPGAMIGPTKQGVDAAIATAPSHQWNDGLKCVVDASDTSTCVASPRTRPVPMMAPPDAPANGRKEVRIANWAGVFLERMQGNDLIVRFAGYSGFSVVTNDPSGPGSLPKIIRLIE
ncbi:MAG: pilus assembly protein TadG-related protein [Gemmatimonadota bacterium]|nr:pilus assembly protein TadG-related protein [Gemmatimonadota bacterium]